MVRHRRRGNTGPTRPAGQAANPVNAARVHLRRGMRVLWLDDSGHYLLARVEAVGRGPGATARPGPPGAVGDRMPLAHLRFPNGLRIVTSIHRLHPLPRHDNPRYFRRTPAPIPVAWEPAP